MFQSSRGNCSAQLRANVQRTWPQEVQDLDVDTAILRLEQRIALLREARRQERISAWKQDMAAMGRKATKWLKRSVTVLPASVSRLTSEGIQEVSGNNQQALLFLKDFGKMYGSVPLSPRSFGVFVLTVATEPPPPFRFRLIACGQGVVPAWMAGTGMK